ncbi:hypothetical protein ACFQ7F_26005 [Streptomyces sp. NPDC056486]|uniref:hypothetical protein n=1 Tax=Streptomyces sp. NPDC056486 TaxID=3345835 RepID=UPI003686E4D7
MSVLMMAEISTESERNPEPREAAGSSGAGRHRGPVAERDEAGAPRGRHRRQGNEN